MSRELVEFCFKLIREGKFDDIAISGPVTLRSFKLSYGIDDIMECISNNKINELLFRKRGRQKFSDRIQVYKVTEFWLNDKSVTFKTDSPVWIGNKQSYRYNIKF